MDIEIALTLMISFGMLIAFIMSDKENLPIGKPFGRRQRSSCPYTVNR